MRVRSEIRAAPVGDWAEAGPPIESRLALADEPDAEIVASYVLTRGAEAAWAAINDQLNRPRGELFWIGGVRGSGKTHFLNYAVALGHRAAAADLNTGRYLTVAVDAAQRGADDLERQLVERIASQLAGDNRAATLWRQMSGYEALVLALDQAKRQGVKGIFAALDLGERDLNQPRAALGGVGVLARESRALRLIVLGAGRASQCADYPSFAVAPGDDEAVDVICSRARRLHEEAWPHAVALYHNIEAGGWEPRQIYPLHPAAAEGLKRLYRHEEGIGTAAEIVREAIIEWGTAKRQDRLMMPAELIRHPQLRRMLEGHLGEAGSAALAMGRRAAASLADRRCAAAGAIVDTLALHLVTGATAGLTLARLADCLPIEGSVPADDVEALIIDLAGRAEGVIRYEAGAVRFDPRPAGGPEITAFNAAIGLLRRFDQALRPVATLVELGEVAVSLAEALSTAAERCHRSRETLTNALHEGGSGLNEAQQRVFEAYGELAESGMAALIQRGAQAEGRRRALEVVAEYETLAAAARAVPRLRAVREYLAGTGLGRNLEVNPAFEGNRGAASLETECQLLTAAAAPAALLGSARNLEALEARFHQFKLNYSRHYRDAHARWGRAMAQLAARTAEAQADLQALGRLNRIAALGPPTGIELAARMAAATSALKLCEALTETASVMTTEINPRCGQCDFVIGAEAPEAAIDEICTLVRHAVEARLAALSQSAIARLIEQHDHEGRLDGFLKITQAAQTRALARLIDDKLADYLNDLLNENGLGGALSLAKAAPVRARGTHARRGNILEEWWYGAAAD